MPGTKPGESVAVEQNLLKRFVDDGGMILGRALETETGRELYERIKNQVFLGTQLYSIYRYHNDPDISNLNAHSPNAHSLFSSFLSDDEIKILLAKMIKKAVDDVIREILR